MSISLNMLYSFQIQELRMANRKAPTEFICVPCCIQKVYGLICPVQIYHAP
jgi:hypothetical protein